MRTSSPARRRRTQVNLDRGFEQTQTNASGNVDIVLSNSSFLSARGGYFLDNYNDTGIPNTTNYIYQTSSVGLAGIPASLQGPIGTQNTPRALIVEQGRHRPVASSTWTTTTRSTPPATTRSRPASATRTR